MGIAKAKLTGLLLRGAFPLAAASFLMAAEPGLAQDTRDDSSGESETVFPDGSSFGIIPFEGSAEAAEFTGFADVETNASVLINEVPLRGWDELSANFMKPEIVARAGITATSFEEFIIAGMPAIRISGTQSVQGTEIPKCLVLVKGTEKVAILTAQIPDTDDFGGDACAMIKGIKERANPTLPAQIAALPFALNDLAGMRVSQVMGGSSVILTKGPLDMVPAAEQPVLIVASSLSPSALDFDHITFSQSALGTLRAYSLEETIESTQTTLADLPATRIVKSGRDESSGEEVRVAQWIIFKPDGNYVRLIGAAAADEWDDIFPAFQAIAAGVVPTIPAPQ